MTLSPIESRGPSQAYLGERRPVLLSRWHEALVKNLHDKRFLKHDDCAEKQFFVGFDSAPGRGRALR